MNQDNLYKKLRIICLILAIVCMGLSLFKKANAETMDYKYQVYFDEVFKEYSNYNEVAQYIDLCFDNCNDFRIIKLYNYINNVNRDGIYMFNATGATFGTTDDYSVSSVDNGYYQYWNNNYYLKKAFFTNTDCLFTVNNSDCIGIIFYCRDNNISVILCYVSSYGGKTIYPTNGNAINGYEGSTNYSIIVNKNNIYNRQDGPYLVKYTDSLFATWRNSYNNYVLGSRSENVLDVPDVPINNTEGFDVYKYGASGSERLVCDFADCISISNAVGNSSTIQIDLTIDGVDQTFNFDSTSSYYDYSVASHIANYSFPFSVFGINSETIYTKLTGVKIVNTTTSPGGSGSKDIVWVTPLTLVGSDYEDLEPEYIPKEQMPDFDKFDDEDIQTNYNGTINRWLTSGNSSFDYSLYTRWNFEPKYYIIPVIYYGASQAAIDALKAALNLDFGQAIDDVISIAQGVSIEDQIQEFMQENYYLNDLYDILVFAYESSSGADTVYYIFTTDSYNNHLSNSFLYDVLQAIYDDGKALEKTYDFLYDKLTDFEDKSLTKLNEMVGLQELENGFISSLQSILNQILNALLNLNIDIPEADYSSITSRLDNIISNQGSSSINNDWYQNYRSWLYAQDTTDNIISPHEFFIEIFDPIKNTYDAFVNNNSIAGYIADMDLFVEYLSGKIDDNLSIYFKDSIGSPNFDINDNTMLTAGGIQ